MKSCSNSRAVERAQPWLGTFVSMRVSGLPVAEAHLAMDAAFEEVALVHCRMSFHEYDSDVSKLNREGSCRSVAVHLSTLELLRWALAISAHSEGCFDISVGAELVEWGLLPWPAGATCLPDGSWRDIELQSDCRVLFHRPLWIDLGGIAKGYAVDRAVECLREWGAESAVVNAGGDIRVHGPRVERIGLDLEFPVNPAPVLELENGSMASSSGHRNRCQRGGMIRGPHVHGRRRTSAPTDRFVSVVAERCVVADALTKVVMAEGSTSGQVLRQFGASAHTYDARNGWQHLAGDRKVQ